MADMWWLSPLQTVPALLGWSRVTQESGLSERADASKQCPPRPLPQSLPQSLPRVPALTSLRDGQCPSQVGFGHDAVEIRWGVEGLT